MRRFTTSVACILGAGLIVTSSASAAVIMNATGFAATGEKNAAGTANVPVGNLFLLVADTGTAGFGASTTNTITNGQSLSVGSLIGGDTIFYSGTDSPLAGASSVSITNLDVTSLAGDKFALLWFNTATGATTQLATGDQYGFTTDATWVLPTATTITGFSATPNGSTPYQTVANPGNASLTVAPEPASSTLVLLGLSGLFLRRRRA